MPRAWASCASLRRRNRSEATRRTVIVATAANLLVGLPKLAAGILSGSSAMLAESVHSAADTRVDLSRGE
jgi:divalent metal cation (Fe/Co/Zn/Cd) transporter